MTRHAIAAELPPGRSANWWPGRPPAMEDAEVSSTEILLREPKRFVRETLVMPGGDKLDWYYVDTPPSVMIVPVMDDGHMVMVYQYRYNLKRHTLEFPAGTVGEGEAPEDAARRELNEETGFSPAPGGQLVSLGAFYSLPSETNKVTHVFLASPVIPAGPSHKDDVEQLFNMSVNIVTPSQATGAIGDTITGTETITALMLARAALRLDA